MKREGRQHGTVRTIPQQSYATLLNQKKQTIDPNNSPPATAGIFTRVTTKPTNHSKFTGKCERARCGGCHFHPAWRSKDKIKGTHKLRSSNMAMDYGGFMAWRVNVSNNHHRHRLGSNKLKLDGYSASRILDELTSNDGYYYSHLDYANEEDDYPHQDQRLNTCYDYNDDRPDNDEHYEDDDDKSTPPQTRIELMGMGVIPLSISCDGDCGDRIEEFVLDDSTTITTTTATSDEDDDVDDDMGGFFDVAIVWETIDGDEGWSIIGEI